MAYSDFADRPGYGIASRDGNERPFPLPERTRRMLMERLPHFNDQIG